MRAMAIGSKSNRSTVAPADGGLGESAHVVRFYEGDTFLVAAVADFVEAGLQAGDPTVVIATASHRRQMEARLRARGVDVRAARKAGRYLPMDAEATLAQILRDEQPDAVQFSEVIGRAIERAAGGSRRVRAFGEMVGLLWREGRPDAALRLEALWSGLAREQTLTLLCAYPMVGLGGGALDENLAAVCAEHSDVISGESYAAAGDVGQRLQAILWLQHKAQAYDLATRERQTAEESLRQRERELRESNATLAALVSASPLPIVVVDPDARVRVWNPAAERLFGWTASEVVGRPLPIAPSGGVKESRLMREALARGETFSGVETRRRRRDGSLVSVTISAAPLATEDGADPGMVFLFEDLSSRKPAEETRAQLAAIVESCEDAIIGKTLEGIVTSWNRGAEAIFGYRAEEMIGQPISRLVPLDRQNDLPKILGAMFRGERVDHFVTERVRKDGRRIYVSLTESPIRDSMGRIIGTSKIARDVTDLKRAETEREELVAGLERARREAEIANRTKDEFLAMLSHELRNPLSAVRSAIVSARLDDQRRDRALGIARRQTEQLAHLIDDLLDVSRITQGRIALRKEEVYLAAIIDAAVEATRSLVLDRGHVLSVSLIPHDLRVDGDPTRLQQIVSNLVTNAAKYSEKGGRIDLFVERQGEEAVVRVRDTGIGIAPDMLPRVFDLFAQGKRELDRTEGGLGIGLTVVRSLTEMHGGRVEARSDGLGKGAEFIVRLPALPSPPGASLAPGSPTEVAARGVGTRVLLVEDNPDAAESLAMLLELLGHRVCVVPDGPTALEVAPANPPDVMLVDIGLPGMDGYEVARRVRQHPGLKNAVLVALTGYGRDEDRRCALAAGFDHHLVKPVDPDALESLVARLAKAAPADPDAEAVH